MTFDPTSVEVTCVTLPKDHCVQVPWEYINVCGYSDQFCKGPLIVSMKISLCTEKSSWRFFVTKSDENHIMSYLTPFLISLKEVCFNFQWNGRNFNKLIKSSVKTEGWIAFNLSSHYTCVGFYDPHETLWKGCGYFNRVIHVVKSCFVSHESGVNQLCADVFYWFEMISS